MTPTASLENIHLLILIQNKREKISGWGHAPRGRSPKGRRVSAHSNPLMGGDGGSFGTSEGNAQLRSGLHDHRSELGLDTEAQA